MTQIFALSSARAYLLACGSSVFELDLGPETQTETHWPRARGAGNAMAVGVDRAILVRSGDALLAELRDGAGVGQAIPGATVAAASADGSIFAVSGAKWDHVRVIDRYAKEVARLPLDYASGVEALAVDSEHVAACGAGKVNRATYVWSLPERTRVLRQAFDDGNECDHSLVLLGAKGKLLILAHHAGSFDVYDLKSEARVMRCGELGPSRLLSLRASPDGRRLGGANGWGEAGAWDLEAVLEGRGRDDLSTIDPDPPRALATPRVLVTPVASPVGGEALTLPIGNAPAFVDVVRGAAIFRSLVDRTTTLVDLTSDPPRCVTRATIVREAARRADGRWLIVDRHGLWETDEFAAQGTALHTGVKTSATSSIGLLDDRPVVWDQRPTKPPLLLGEGGWRSITGLAPRSERDGVKCVLIAGASFLAWAGVAYRVAPDGVAKIAFNLHEHYLGGGVALDDGRFFFPAASALWKIGADHVATPFAQSKLFVEEVLPGGVPGGAIRAALVTFGANGGNRTAHAGMIANADGTSTLIEKARFGVEKKVILSPLIAAPGRIFAQISDTATFAFAPHRW